MSKKITFDYVLLFDGDSSVGIDGYVREFSVTIEKDSLEYLQDCFYEDADSKLGHAIGEILDDEAYVELKSEYLKECNQESEVQEILDDFNAILEDQKQIEESKNIIEIYGEDSFRCSCCNKMFDNDQGDILVPYSLEDDSKCQVCEECFCNIAETESESITCYRNLEDNDL